METIAFNITQEEGFYNEDTTIHLFFEPRYEIKHYFDTIKYIPLKVNRCVRSMENVLSEYYFKNGQIDLMQKNCTLLRQSLQSL